VVSSGMTFLSNFVDIGKLVQKLLFEEENESTMESVHILNAHEM
jgi:hypothetical protein